MKVDNKLLKRPTQQLSQETPARYEKFQLTENPFPSQPVVNKDSEDKRINGDIYEADIRTVEFEQVKRNFLEQPQADINHLRLGYIIDTSFIGRGNGKSAFLVNLQQEINSEYCLNLSFGRNKCFAISVTPESGGRTKTFASFVDSLFSAIINAGIIDVCLATLRLEALMEVYSERDFTAQFNSEEELISSLNSTDWFSGKNIDIAALNGHIYKNEFLKKAPEDFPLFQGKHSLFAPFNVVTQEDFRNYYKTSLKRPADRIEFVFTTIIYLFQAAGFNGAYIFVDDFERIPDFQSTRQKKDFALEIRSCLFDGSQLNARIGFYNFLLVLHAGVPNMIAEAWGTSGMDQRAPIEPKATGKHIVRFEKLSKDHAFLLLKKYLGEFRVPEFAGDELAPFSEDVIKRIGELAEYNAGRILKLAYDLLERAADDESQFHINGNFLNESREVQEVTGDKPSASIADAPTTDLFKKG